MALEALLPHKATLRAAAGEIDPKEFALTPNGCTLGRSSSCDIVVHSQAVSRLHARIEWHGQYFILSDMGSSNGTYVNGRQVEGPYRLRNQDGIGLGSGMVALRFTDHDATTILPPRLQYIRREQRFVYHGVALGLSPQLTRLLTHLYLNAGEVCSRESCIQAIWNDKERDPDRIPLLHKEISELRNKLKEIDPNHEIIKGRRGIGYYLNLEW